MAILMTMLAAWLFMAIAPKTPIGRALQHGLVDWPASWLNRRPAGQVAAVATLVLLGGMVLMVGGGNGANMLIMSAPELATWLTTFEIATYLDVMIATVATWSTLQVQGVLRRLRLPGRRSGRGTRRPVQRVVADNDDEPHRYSAAA